MRLLPLLALAFVASCSEDPAAGAAPRDSGADSPSLDDARGDATPLDAGADSESPDDAKSDAPPVDAGADAPPADGSTGDSGGPVCPAVGGGYTVEVRPAPGTCPAGGPNTYGFNLALDAATCVVSFSGFEDPLNILYLTGSAKIDEQGNFSSVRMTLNGTSTICGATYTAGPPKRYAFDCGGCEFTILLGE